MIVHCAMTKDYLRREIQTHGAAAVLEGLAPGTTDADALAEIDRDPRELFVIGECDSLRPDGGCAGHPTGADGAP